MNYRALMDTAQEMEAIGYVRSHCDGASFAKRPKTQKAFQGKPMIFMHVHKGAGVLICHGARKNENVIKPQAVCSGRADQVTDIGKGTKLSCEQRKKQMGGASFAMIERDVQAEDLDCAEHFRYGIVIRDPLALAESMTNWDQYNIDHGPKLPHSHWSEHLSCLKAGDEGARCKTLRTSVTGLYNFYDNYLVRTMGGSEMFHKAPGTITEADADAVIDKLKKFDIAMSFNHADDFAKLTKALGWGLWSPAQNDKHVRPHTAAKLSKEGLAEIKERLGPDYKVYRYFVNNPNLGNVTA